MGSWEGHGDTCQREKQGCSWLALLFLTLSYMDNLDPFQCPDTVDAHCLHWSGSPGSNILIVLWWYHVAYSLRSHIPLLRSFCTSTTISHVLRPRSLEVLASAAGEASVSLSLCRGDPSSVLSLLSLPHPLGNEPWLSISCPE